jgi:hypothetical protein
VVAFWERLKIKDVISDAIGEYLDRYESKNGKIKPIKQAKRNERAIRN